MYIIIIYVTFLVERRNSSKQPNCMRRLTQRSYKAYNNGLKKEKKVNTRGKRASVIIHQSFPERERLQQEATQRLTQLSGSATRKVHATEITWSLQYVHLQAGNTGTSRGSGWEAIQKSRSSSHKHSRQLAASADTTQRGSSQAPLIASMSRYVNYTITQ